MNIPDGRRARDEPRSGLSLATVMSIKLDVPQSGKVGSTVNLKTRYGQIQRAYTIPKDPKTPAQMRIRSNLGHIAPHWRELEQEQRDAWTLSGRDAETVRRLGRSVPLKGFYFYQKINCSRASLGLDQFDVPPALPQFKPNPVGDLAATNDDGAIALKLSVPSRPGQYTIVWGAAPCSAGRSSAQHYKILGFLPDPVRGVSEITDLYVAVFGPIPPGSRVFIRTQQHIDGWTDLPNQTNAIVPKS